MRIAHLTPFFPPSIGGRQAAVHNIARSQAADGHAVFVVCPWRSWRWVSGWEMPYALCPMPPRLLALYTARFVRTGTEPWLNKRLIGLWIQALHRRIRPDVWHVHSLYPTGTAVIDTLEGISAATVVTPHGLDILRVPGIGYGDRLHAAIDGLVRSKAGRFDWATSLSPAVTDELIGLGIAPNRIVEIPHGVAASQIRARLGARGRVREQLGVRDDTPVIITVGRNHPAKGFDLIPRMASTLKGHGADFVWLVVGPGAEAVTGAEADTGRLGHLRAIGPVAGDPHEVFAQPPSRLVDLYAAGDIFVFPSRAEAFGLVLLEAMAAGLAVATTDAPGCRAVVASEETGLTSPAGDADAMSHNVLRLLTDHELRVRLQHSARKVASTFEWRDVARRYSALYAGQP